MPKCPTCGLEINHVIVETTETTRYTVRLPVGEAEKLSLDYEPDIGLVWFEDTSVAPVEDRYTCPECHKEVAQNDEEVAKFLKGDEHG
jgi:endogenous inhibitor of DNA gyrase (YacG/DUF329 family)